MFADIRKGGIVLTIEIFYNQTNNIYKLSTVAKHLCNTKKPTLLMKRLIITKGLVIIHLQEHKLCFFRIISRESNKKICIYRGWSI
jgi:hypothetical protein